MGGTTALVLPLFPAWPGVRISIMASSDLTFITNEPGGTLRQRFADLLAADTSRFDCLVGYFFISGFHRLYPSLEKVEKIRILVGLRTDRSVWELLRDAREPPGVSPERQKAVEGLVDGILAAKAADAEADASALGREIDQLVYELYGLAPEEMATVDGAD